MFTFPGHHYHAQLQWKDPEQFWTLISQITGLPRSHIRGFHLVRTSPSDLATAGRKAFILHSLGDGPSSDLLRAVLVDIEIECTEPPERRVRWIQYKITRRSLLRVLHLESLCWWVTDECTVWQTGYIVPENQIDPLDIFHMATT